MKKQTRKRFAALPVPVYHKYCKRCKNTVSLMKYLYVFIFERSEVLRVFRHSNSDHMSGGPACAVRILLFGGDSADDRQPYTDPQSCG